MTFGMNFAFGSPAQKTIRYEAVETAMPIPATPTPLPLIPPTPMPTTPTVR